MATAPLAPAPVPAPQEAPAPSESRPPATGATLLDLLTAAFAKFAARPALLIKPGFRTRIWSHGDLAEAMPRVARVFSGMGLQRGDRVVIWAINRPEWCLAYLGALHAGIVLVPLDVRSRPGLRSQGGTPYAGQGGHRLAADCGPRRWPQAPHVLIESIPDRAREMEPMPPVEIGPADLVEVVFTSGTTGEPKGAMITQANLAANATTLGEVFPFQRDERLLSILPLSHLFEQTCGFLAPLLRGCSIVYPVSRQPASLIRTFRDNRVTMLLVVPAGLKLLNNAIERKVDATGKRSLFERLHRVAARAPRPIRRLLFRSVLSQFGGKFRTLAIGAAALETELAIRWIEMGFTVLQGYGATELSPVVSFTHPARNRLGTVGQAIPGVEIRIGEDGEVLARGPNVFAGYWEDPDATAAAIDADGFYHTGDIGELSNDGFLTLRGRKKDMLAMPDGTKVYPEDVEAVLARDPRIRDATVVGWQPPRADLRVHAVLLMDDPSRAEWVIRDANEQLGAHQQIRSHSIWTEEDFPRTHTLKVKKRIILDHLRSDLPGAPPPATAAAARSEAASVDPVTALIAAVAGLPAAAVEASACLSSDLNLDSLARVELLGVIEEEIGVYIDDGGSRTGDDRRRAGWHGRRRARDQARFRHLRLAAQPHPAGDRHRSPGALHAALLLAHLPRAGVRFGAPQRAAWAGALHAQPPPAQRRGDHPDPVPAGLALAALGGGSGRRHLRQPPARLRFSAHRQRVPAGSRGRHPAQPGAAGRTPRSRLQRPHLP